MVNWKYWFWERNESTPDRAVRIVGGLVLLYVFFQNYIGGWLNYVVLLIGLIGLITGIIGHCLIYALLGIRTDK